jgi:hypothetical protein
MLSTGLSSRHALVHLSRFRLLAFYLQFPHLLLMFHLPDAHLALNLKLSVARLVPEHDRYDTNGRQPYYPYAQDRNIMSGIFPIATLL